MIYKNFELIKLNETASYITKRTQNFLYVDEREIMAPQPTGLNKNHNVKTISVLQYIAFCDILL